MTIREFESYFKALYLPLGMYALRIVEDIDQAEDTVQEAFAKAWIQVEGGAEIGNFKSYIYRMVRNEAISILRQRKTNIAIEDAGDVPEEQVDTSERDAKLWAAIDDLPDRCREIFLMSKRDGLSNQEIADELGLSVSTVKNQMSKAFDKLRTALSEHPKAFFLPFL